MNRMKIWKSSLRKKIKRKRSLPLRNRLKQRSSLSRGSVSGIRKKLVIRKMKRMRIMRSKKRS